MNDQELVGVWTALEATDVQQQRMQARVFGLLEARDTSLASEWIGLFRLSPVSAFGLLAGSTASLATATPILWLARALL